MSIIGPKFRRRARAPRDSSPTDRWRKAGEPGRAGMTLLELMLVMGMGTLVLAALLLTTLFVSRAMLAISNYDELNAMSRNALDWMTRDIRNTATLTSYATNRLVFTNRLTGDQFSYTWDGSNDLTRVYTYSDGSVTVTPLLKDCDTLDFRIYSRVPSNNFSFYPTANVKEAKLIDVTWRCSRKIYGKKINTESVQTAKIVIRN